ncbi:MAG: Asp-tRNA(Asn)/Glu-tRNA(Gln) amidotransferase subunit GatC [Chloroflexota bacterium]
MLSIIIPGMTLSIDEVEHIAQLARLELTPAEKERFRRQLSDILEYAARLQQVDTSGIPPTSSVLPAHSRLRDDDPLSSLPREAVLANAPQQRDDQFQVPPVLE